VSAAYSRSRGKLALFGEKTLGIKKSVFEAKKEELGKQS
jgi:hypothetical protein